MKNRTLLLTLLLASLSLASCGGSSTPSESDESTFESISSETESLPESESEQESFESESEPEDLETLLSTRQNFKKYFTNWMDKNELSSISYILDDTKAYKKGVSEVSLSIGLNEIVSDKTFTGVDEANSYKEFLYYGLFETQNVYYEVVLDNTNQTANEYFLVDSEEMIGQYKDRLTLEDAKLKFNNQARSRGAQIVGQTLGWNLYINGTAGFNDLSWSYDYDETTETYTVYGDTVVVGSLDITRYSLEVNIQNENIISGKLQSTAYYKEDFDLELNIPKDNAVEKNHKHSEIISVEYEEKNISTTPSVEILEDLLIESISDFSFYPCVYDTTILEDVYGEKNTVFANSIVEIRYDELAENVTYLPETAINLGSLIIIDSSNKDAVYLDERDNWVVTDKIGQTTQLSIGNSRGSLYQLSVEVVENPTIHPTPEFNNNDILCVSETATSSKNNNVRTITIPGNETSVIFGLPTTNEGPFDLTDYSFSFTDYNFYPSIAYNQAFYAAENGYNYVYVEVYGYAPTTATVELLNADGEVVTSFQIKVQ